MYILDSSAIIELLAGSPLGGKIVTLVGDEPLATTVISFVEVMTGVKGKKEDAATQFFQSVPVFTLNGEAAKQCVLIQERLKEHGKPMEHSDLFIAGICKQNNLSLVTCDKDFIIVKELNVLLVR